MKNGPEKPELLLEAIDKYAKAIAIKHDKHVSIANWGSALCRLSDLKKGNEKEELLYKAIEKCKRAIVIKYDYDEAFLGWGIVLEKLSDLKKGQEKEELLCEAIDKFEKAIAIKPDKSCAFNLWGFTLLRLAAIKKGRAKVKVMAKLKILDEAIEKLLICEGIKRGEGAYNLGCAYAMKGNEDKCREWLKVGEEEGTLAMLAHALGDDNLVSVRNKAWFKGIKWESE